MPLVAVPAVGDLEFIVQDELIFQGRAQIIIVVDEKDLSGRAHGRGSGFL